MVIHIVLLAVWVRAEACKISVNQSAGTVSGCVDGTLDLSTFTAWRLTDLTLTSNNFTSLPKDVFKYLGELHRLTFSNNAITSLWEGVFNGLSNLSELHLAGNNFTSLPEGVFGGLLNLRELYLDNNNLTLLPERVFQELPKLTLLDLSRNKLAVLPSHVFRNLTSLDTLDLTFNQFSGFPCAVRDMSWLKGLRLANNPFTVTLLPVPQRLCNILDLEVGVAAACQVDSVLCDAAEDMRNGEECNGNPMKNCIDADNVCWNTSGSAACKDGEAACTCEEKNMRNGEECNGNPMKNCIDAGNVCWNTSGSAACKDGDAACTCKEKTPSVTATFFAD